MEDEILEITEPDNDEENLVTTEYSEQAFTATPIEESVIKRAIGGDEKAFEALFMGTYRYVFASVRKYLKNDQDAYDAIQETYTRVYKSISRIESTSNFYPWLHRIAENCAKDVLRLSGRDVPLSQDNETPESAEQDHSYKSDVSADVTEVLKQLPKEQAELLIRVYYDKLRVAEIARMQGIPVTTVHNRLNAAKKKLKELLKIRGIDKPIYGGDFISMISIALRNAIGTELLSMAVAEEILHNVTGSQNKKGAFVISRFARKERSKAALKIATMLLAVCLLITAIALFTANIIAKKFYGGYNTFDKTASSSVSETVRSSLEITGDDIADSSSQTVSEPMDKSNVASLGTSTKPATSSSAKPTSSATSSSSKSASSATSSTASEDTVKFLGSFDTTEIFGTSVEDGYLNIATSGDKIYSVVNGNLISVKNGSTSPTVLINDFQKLYGNSGFCLNVFDGKVYWVNKNSQEKFVLNRCNIDGTGHYSVVFSDFDCTYISRFIVAKDGIYFTAGIHGDFDHLDSGVLYRADYNFKIDKQISGVADYALIKNKLYYLYGKGNNGYLHCTDRATFENRTEIKLNLSYGNLHSFGDYLVLEGYNPYGHPEALRSEYFAVMDTVSGELVRFIEGEAGDVNDVKDVSDFGGGTIIYTYNGTPRMLTVKTGEDKTISSAAGTIYGNYRYNIKSGALYRSDIDGKSSKKIY